MNQYDVIVIGAGVMGSATAYYLAKRGRRVLLLEQFGFGHERGSSHGHSRIFRVVYDLPEYVRLAQAALPLWRELEAETGAELLLQTGGLDFADQPEQSINATRACLEATGVPFELLSGQELRQRFPQFSLSEQAVGLYQAESGILDATKSVLSMVGAARVHGAAVHENEPVQEIRAGHANVTVQTAQATYTADRLVLSAGSWARPLARQLGLELPLIVTKEQVAYFAPHTPELYAPGRCPIYIQHLTPGPSVYGFPMFGAPAVKVAFHHHGPQVEPEDEDRSVEMVRLAALQAHVARWMPQAAGEVVLSQTCRYTSTPDHEFILDTHPAYPHIVIGSPCSGHGFKFGVLFGSILADLAESGRTKHQINRFRLGRFRQ